MDHLIVLLAPLAALLPAPGPADAVSGGPGVEAAGPWAGGKLFPPPEAPEPLYEDGRTVLPMADSFRPEVENQVRIEQRITIRISPRAPTPRPFDFDLPDRPPARVVERNFGRCLPIAGIAGVQVGQGNRLMVFLRDRRTVSLGLEKACRPQDFYSGFYVERNADGQLCVDRDRLQSRSGANCALTRLRQLVEE
ncbi:MAG: hypothetical protein QM676_14255 [Novosphingobium sp.]